MTNKALSVVILAAGKGTRMYSDLPKVLHKVAGKPMVKHVIDTANQLGAENVHLIYGHGGELMRERLANESVNWVVQARTIRYCSCGSTSRTILQRWWKYCDFIWWCAISDQRNIGKLIAAKPDNGIALLTVNLDNPTGYGRIIRENGNVVAIVEQKDANAEQLKNSRSEYRRVKWPMVHISKNWLSRVKNNMHKASFI